MILLTILASSSYTLTNLFDGKTPYWHTAYANSADGKTDFSLTVSDGKRYIGQYVDYSTTNSTDYTKYKWVDMVGSVSVGVNLLKNSATRVENSYYQIAKYDLTTVPIDGETYTITIFGSLSPTKTQFNIYNSGGSIRLTPIKKISTGIYSATFVWKSTYTASDGTVYTADNSHIRVYAAPSDNTISSIDKIILTKGNVFQDHSQAPEDIDAKIDTKADDALTQEQLLAIAEEQRLMKADTEATASLEEFQNKSKELLDQIQAIANGQKVSEQILTDNASRIVQLAGQIGAVNLVTEAITKYMSFSDDGLIIGMKDGSSSVRVANDRISFYSAGKETAFISQGFLQIESGIFTLRLQIASFLFEESASGQLLIKKIR